MGKARLRILLVEDSAPVCNALCELLGEIEGLEVSAITDGAMQARAAITRIRPDVIVLDLVLAEGSGLDVLRSEEWKDNRPFTVVFSGDCTGGIRTACKRLGASAVLDKASEFHLLQAVLRDLI